MAAVDQENCVIDENEVAKAEYFGLAGLTNVFALVRLPETPGKTGITVAKNSKGTVATIKELVDNAGRLVGFVVNQDIVSVLEKRLQSHYGNDLKVAIFGYF